MTIMSELSQTTQKLIQQYQVWHQFLQPKEEVSTIHVDEVASKVAAFYEKLRGIIDWKEEHLLKRGAIERALKRRFFGGMDLINGRFSEKIAAEPLVLELIRGGHFPNDKIEESKIKEVQKVLNKYIFILNNSSLKQKKSKPRLYNWLSSIAACEIEEILTPSIKEKALINYMFESMKERIRVKERTIVIGGFKEEEINIQIYIAVHRALFNLDSPIISYHLLKYKYPEWKDLPEQKFNEIAKNIYLIWEQTENDLNHPLTDKFYKVCEKYSTPYLLLGDILSKDPMKTKEKIVNPENLEGLTRQAYNKRLKTLKSRLARAAFYSTLSIFLTNVVSLLAIEIPFTRYVTGRFNLFAVAIDIFVPTLLMFFLVVTIKPPKKGNLERVIMEVVKIVYKKERKDIYQIKAYPKRSFIFNLIITLLYALSSCLMLGLIIWGLSKVNFPILSYIIFIVFLSLIAFAGAKIRQRAKELQVIEGKETFFHLIVDPFAVPVIQLGKWLTVRWKKYNVIAALFNALIDMPFLLFVKFLEQWRYFLKEKKEEIH